MNLINSWHHQRLDQTRQSRPQLTRPIKQERHRYAGQTIYPEEEEMRKEKSLVWLVTALLVVMSLLLASCAPQATEAPPEQEPTEAAPAEPTEAATEAPVATGEATEVAATEAPIDRNYSPDIPEPAEPVTVTFANFNDMETPFWQGM